MNISKKTKASLIMLLICAVISFLLMIGGVGLGVNILAHQDSYADAGSLVAIFIIGGIVFGNPGAGVLLTMRKLARGQKQKD